MKENIKKYGFMTIAIIVAIIVVGYLILAITK